MERFNCRKFYPPAQLHFFTPFPLPAYWQGLESLKGLFGVPL